MSKELQGTALEWRTLVLMAGCYALWVMAGLAWSTSYWELTLIALPVSIAFHTSLQHETIHGHPTRWAWLNELLVSLPLVAVFPYRRYRALHLQHHNDQSLTDPYEDPESYFWPEPTFLAMRPMVKWIFIFNNTLVGRLWIGPALGIIGFLRTEFSRIKLGEPGVRKAWLLHGVGLIALALVVNQLFSMPFWAYGLIGIYPAMSLISLRSFAEHQAAEAVGARTAVVETAAPLSLLYLNNNLHIVHHANPNVPWYDLPDLYQERRDIFLAANDHTLFRGYGEIARRFAFTSKQSVEHPYFYRAHRPDPAKATAMPE